MAELAPNQWQKLAQSVSQFNEQSSLHAQMHRQIACKCEVPAYIRTNAVGGAWLMCVCVCVCVCVRARVCVCVCVCVASLYADPQLLPLPTGERISCSCDTQPSHSLHSTWQRTKLSAAIQQCQ